MMDFALGPRAAQAGYRVLPYDSLDSTNSEAIRLARAGERGPLWIVAREQTAGRGRRGRDWVSMPGNLFATLLKTGRYEIGQAATLGFVAAVAAFDACRSLVEGVPMSLKWPNDLLANGRKVAGILLESEPIGDQLAIAIGFGINLWSAPTEKEDRAISLATFGAAISPEHMFASLTDAFHYYDSVWSEGLGFPAIRNAWLQRAGGVGEVITVDTGSRVRQGTFETIDGHGQLMLRDRSGDVFTVSAGDVYFGNAATLRDSGALL